jgi:hypothetical protein
VPRDSRRVAWHPPCTLQHGNRSAARSKRC